MDVDIVKCTFKIFPSIFQAKGLFKTQLKKYISWRAFFFLTAYHSDISSISDNASSKVTGKEKKLMIIVKSLL